jgi:hypothetical protein
MVKQFEELTDFQWEVIQDLSQTTFALPPTNAQPPAR